MVATIPGEEYRRSQQNPLRVLLPASRALYHALKPVTPKDPGNIVVVNFEEPNFAQDRFVPLDLKVLQARELMESGEQDVTTALTDAAGSLYTLSGVEEPLSPRGSKEADTSSVRSTEPQHPYDNPDLNIGKIRQVSEQHGNNGIIIINLGLPVFKDLAQLVTESLADMWATRRANEIPSIGLIDKGANNAMSKRESGLSELIGKRSLVFTIDRTGYPSHARHSSPTSPEIRQLGTASLLEAYRRGDKPQDYEQL